MAKTVRKIKESDTGRNIEFIDISTETKMTRAEFVSAIEKDKNDYANDYYVRKQNGIKTPVSKPDGKKRNNLD